MIRRFIISIILFLEVNSHCQLTEVKSLLEGCRRLSGLNITSIGGTVVNDHNCDVLLPKQVFTEEPMFQYPSADSDKYYTILMLDPDAPSHYGGQFFVHLMKVNIPGVALNTVDSGKGGTDYRVYKPPNPPRGTGSHRYMCLVYEQSDGNTFVPTLTSIRSKFNLAQWLTGTNLCGPVAGTMFRSEYYL